MLVFVNILIKDFTNNIIERVRLNIRSLTQIIITKDYSRDYNSLKYVKDDLVSISLNK